MVVLRRLGISPLVTTLRAGIVGDDGSRRCSGCRPVDVRVTCWRAPGAERDGRYPGSGSLRADCSPRLGHARATPGRGVLACEAAAGCRRRGAHVAVGTLLVPCSRRGGPCPWALVGFRVGVLVGLPSCGRPPPSSAPVLAVTMGLSSLIRRFPSPSRGVLDLGRQMERTRGFSCVGRAEERASFPRPHDVMGRTSGDRGEEQLAGSSSPRSFGGADAVAAIRRLA